MSKIKDSNNLPIYHHHYHQYLIPQSTINSTYKSFFEHLASKYTMGFGFFSRIKRTARAMRIAWSSKSSNDEKIPTYEETSLRLHSTIVYLPIESKVFSLTLSTE